jgi:hypothetical protein
MREREERKIKDLRKKERITMKGEKQNKMISQHFAVA